MEHLPGKFEHIQQPRKRGFSPKVRTGCVSCKDAHVKCNENKPACKRCVRRMIECCYRDPVARIFQTSNKGIDKEMAQFQFVFKQTRCKRLDSPTCEPLQPVPFHRGSSPTPRSGSSRRTNKSVRRAIAPSTIEGLSCELEVTTPGIELGTCPRLLGSVPFYTSAKHAAAVQYFLEVPAPRIAYNMVRQFCTVTLPQASWTHPAIMESMIALATLSASLRGTSSVKWTTSPPLLHYNKAIKNLVRSKPASNITLLVCMLLWLYDQFDNHHTRALFHRESIARIVAEWRAREIGLDRTMDDYIASYVEPAIATGLEVTAPVKLCREVLGVLHLQLQRSTRGGRPCTYDEALNNLRTCIDSFITRGGEGTCRSDDFLLRTSFTSLQMWNYQFEHCTESNWEVEGPILLSYATAVAILAQEEMPIKKPKDADWQRALEFLRAEASKIGLASNEKDGHLSLLDGIELIVSA